MVVKALIRFSVAALVLLCLGLGGCSEGSDRIFTPPADQSNDQLSLGYETGYVDGIPGDNDGYPIYDDGSGDDLAGVNFDWLDKYNQDTEGGTGGSTKPLDFQHKD